MDKDCDSSGNSTDDARSGAHSPEPPPTQHSEEAESGISSGHSGFTVQPGGRNPMADTAERLGRAAGTAERRMRQGLELVRPAASKGGRTSAYTYAVGGHFNALEKAQDEVAVRRNEDEAEARHEAAHRVGQLGQLSEVAAERVLQLRDRLQDAVERSRRGTRRVVTEHPGQTLAALAGFCVALGVGLCLSGSRRR
jgi:hypothetical protein